MSFDTPPIWEPRRYGLSFDRPPPVRGPGPNRGGYGLSFDMPPLWGPGGYSLSVDTLPFGGRGPVKECMAWVSIRPPVGAGIQARRMWLEFRYAPFGGRGPIKEDMV